MTTCSSELHLEITGSVQHQYYQSAADQLPLARRSFAASECAADVAGRPPRTKRIAWYTLTAVCCPEPKLVEAHPAEKKNKKISLLAHE
mmetsp:Transcript_10403/g.29625  ORF Transcript_10403/g.29625 Transcript_10403/m.29625 type:complete len:89 (-) Transcript_10403:42-308(-)